jgi:hypothetical protein
MTAKKDETTKEIASRRAKQLQELDAAIAELTVKSEELGSLQKKLTLLESVSLGLYEEIDKLAKKAGADEVTPLVLEQVNDVIREAKELIFDDPYVKRYHEFVPAGNNPQHRDVVLLLRQIRQGLERFASGINESKSRTDMLLSDAKGARIAVLFAIQGKEGVRREDLENNEVDVQPRWLRGLPAYFSFPVLDRTHIPSYFSAE